MEQYIVSARKYRPDTFKSVVGQSALASTLKNAIATGRLAHSYLFCGSRGVGKTTCARIMAKTINCEHPTADGEACNECPSCRAFNAGSSLNIIELDAASNNGVDDMRALIDQVQIPPSQGRYRVFIIDEVHMLTTAAFNAFLKTLEEPPSYVVFILATTEKHKILPTILSRCQIYDFSRITIQDMINHMSYVAEQEGIKVEPAALNVIARKADGAMRDALSIFDQVAASSRGNITYAGTLDILNVLDYEYYNRLLECFLTGNVMESWLIYREIRGRGFDSHFFINGLAAYFRDLMVARDPRTQVLLEAGDEARQAMAQAGARCTPEFLYRAMDLCNDADLNYRQASNKQFLVELTLAKLCQLCGPSPSKSGEGKGLKKIYTANADSNVQTATQSAPVSSNQTNQPASTPTPPVEPKPMPKVVPTARQTTPVATHRAGARMPRLTTRPTAKESVETVETNSTVRRTQSYTDAEIRKAWMAFIDANPKEHILINSLRSSMPEQIGPDTYRITVDNEHQIGVITQWMPKLLQSVRDSLGNDDFKLVVEQNQGETSPTTWTQREVFDHIVNQSPAVKKLVSDFGLTL